MSYNPRMSIVPSGQQQNRGKKKEDDSDAFMRLVQILIPSVANL
jgi:kinetochore protein Nuf2